MGFNWGAFGQGLSQGLNEELVGNAINQGYAQHKQTEAEDAAKKAYDEGLQKLNSQYNRPTMELGDPERDKIMANSGAPELRVEGAPESNAGQPAQAIPVSEVNKSKPYQPDVAVGQPGTTAGRPMSQAEYERQYRALTNTYNNAKAQARIDYYRRRGDDANATKYEDELKNAQWHQGMVEQYYGIQSGDAKAMKPLIGYINATMGNGTQIVQNPNGGMSLVGADGKVLQQDFKPSMAQINEAFQNYYNAAKFFQSGDFDKTLVRDKAITDTRNAKRDQAVEEWKAQQDAWAKTYGLAQDDVAFTNKTATESFSNSESIGALGGGKGSGAGSSGTTYKVFTDPETGLRTEYVADKATGNPLARVHSDGSLRPYYMKDEEFNAAGEQIRKEGFIPRMGYNPRTERYELAATKEENGNTLVRFYGTDEWVNANDIPDPQQNAGQAQGASAGTGDSARSHSQSFYRTRVVKPNEGLSNRGFAPGIQTAETRLATMGNNPFPFAPPQPQGQPQAIPVPQRAPAPQASAPAPAPASSAPATQAAAPARAPVAQSQAAPQPAVTPAAQARRPEATQAPQPQNQEAAPAAQQAQAQTPAPEEKTGAAQAIPTESDRGKSELSQFGRWLAEHLGSADKDSDLSESLKDLPTTVGKMFSDAVTRSKEYAEANTGDIRKVLGSVDEKWGISKGVNTAKQKFDEVTDAAERKFNAATKRRATEVSKPSQVGEKLTAAADQVAKTAKGAIEAVGQSMDEATRNRAKEVESSKLNQAIIDQRDRMSANAERMGNMGRRALDDIKTIAEGAAEPVAEYAGKVGEKAKRAGRMAGQAVDDVKTIAKNASKRRAQEASKPSKLNQAIKDKKERVEVNAKRMGDMGRRLVENVKAAGKKFAEDNSVRIEPRQTEEAPAALYGQRVRKNAEKTAAMGRRALDELGDFGKKTKEDLKVAGKKFAEDNAVRVEPRQTEEAPAALYGLQARKGAEKMAGVGRRALDDLRDFGKKTEEDLKAAGKRFTEDNTVRIKPRQEPETAATRYGKKVGDKAKRMGEMGRRAVEDAKTIAKPAAAYAEQVGKKAERMGAMGRRAAEDVGTIVKNAVTEETSAGRAGRAYGKRVKENAGRMGNMGRRAVEDLKKIGGNLSESMSRTYDGILRRIIGAVDPEQDDGSLDEVMEQLSGVLDKGAEREAIPTAKGASKNRRSYAVEDDQAYAALGTAILKYMASQSQVA